MKPALEIKRRMKDWIKECVVVMKVRVRSWNTLNGSLKSLGFILRVLGNSRWIKQKSSLTGHNEGGTGAEGPGTTLSFLLLQ